MKIHSIPAILGLCWSMSLCHAQGTFQFQATLTGGNEVPPNGSPCVATGTFTLEGDTFSYDVSMSGDYQYLVATINGPALPNRQAPTLFTLEPFGLGPCDPDTGRLVGLWTDGSVTLTAPQKADLLAGLWYVEWASFDHPEWNVRGQILPVPEPATWVLFGLGAAALLLRRQPR
jgi:hypothetical protein